MLTFTMLGALFRTGPVESGATRYRVFTGQGNPIRSGNRNLLTGWKDAVVGTVSVGQVYIFMIFGTRETRSLRKPTSAPKTSWHGLGQDSPRRLDLPACFPVGSPDHR
jgi:hypothetical protein